MGLETAACSTVSLHELMVEASLGVHLLVVVSKIGSHVLGMAVPALLGRLLEHYSFWFNVVLLLLLVNTHPNTRTGCMLFPADLQSSSKRRLLSFSASVLDTIMPLRWVFVAHNRPSIRTICSTACVVCYIRFSGSTDSAALC